MSEESNSQDQARAEADALAAWQAIPYSVSHEEAQRISREYLDAARREFEVQIGQLPLAGQDAARQAEMELNANGREVYVNTRWWGFEVVLNAAAAQVAAEISELVGEIAGRILPRPIGRVVELAFTIRSWIIQIVGRHHGCRLVSPWFAPGMLLPISLAPRQDTSLWWTAMNPSHNWSDNIAFPAHRSADGPALAVHNDRLYCVHRGGGNDRRLWWTRFDGNSWSPDTPMNGLTSRGPALATFNGFLYCAYRDSNNDQMWWTRFNGTSWSTDQMFPGHRTGSNPALAVFQGNLWCVHRGGGNDQHLWWTRFTGTTWAGNPQMPNHMSREGVGLAVYNNFLYCVHRGGGNDQNLWWTRFNGTSWSTDTRLPGHMSAQGPAIVAYREPNGTEDQLFCVHRGHG
ncbi:hypothetical protein [Sphaerisporangium corydalis]|uniref:Sialidase n=1 Tax=Sphaerisporangium corydalis TaxID=1441875 RepID=A0ABV9ENG2_9ACTN|nr:hypothetical protein [Sphaerisporangium corydalis]